MNNEIEQAKTAVHEADQELNELIGKRKRLSLEATVRGDKSCRDLEEVESCIGTVTKRLERARLAVEEAKLQAEANKKKQKAKAIDQMVKMLEGLDKEEDSLAAQVREQGQPSAELLDRLVTTARQSHALANELFRVTANAKFRRQWDGEDNLLGKHVDRRRRNPLAARARIEAPWRELLAVTQG